MGMHMTFYWGTNVTVLFSSWTTKTLTHYFVALLLTFLFCILHEFLSTFRVLFSARDMPPPVRASNPLRVPFLQHIAAPSTIHTSVAKGVLYGLHVASAYILMLIVMTFNIGIFIAAVLGHTLGFLLFGYGRYATSCCPELM